MSDSHYEGGMPVIHNRRCTCEKCYPSFQERCLSALRYFDSPERKTAIPASLLNIAIKIGSNRLAVYSAMEALKRKGKVGSFRSRPDMWGVLLWYEIRRERRQP